MTAHTQTISCRKHPRCSLSILGLIGLLVFVWPSVGTAQQLSQYISDRCSRATVKIVALGDNGQGSTGSGAIVDTRGYILTNFHVVGYTHPNNGIPGSLVSSENRYFVATMDSVDQAARPRWIASVVRADVRLDLALLRIISDANGKPIRKHRFPVVELASAHPAHAGDRVWAFGFPLGMRTVKPQPVSISSAARNGLRKISWFKLNQSLDVGYSGGLMVDSRGRLVAIPTAHAKNRRRPEPIRYARTVARIPRPWQIALRKKSIQDSKISGVNSLNLGVTVHDVQTLDTLPGVSRQHHYLLPQDAPLTLRVSPRNAELRVWHKPGRLIRKGKDGLQIQPGDPRATLLSVVFSKDMRKATGYTLWLEKASPYPRGKIFPRPPSPSTVAPSATTPSPAAVSNPFFTAPNATGSIKTSSNGQQGRKATAIVRGRLHDAVTGRRINGGTLVIAKPKVNLERHLNAFMTGRMTEKQFRRGLIGSSRTDIYGRFIINGIPRSQSYSAAAIASGYATVYTSVKVRWHDGEVILGTIQMTR